MKLLFAALIVLSFVPMGVEARTVRVRGHVTKQGRYIIPHERTSPNHTRLDNYSTKGNVNPHTGKSGSQKAWQTKK